MTGRADPFSPDDLQGVLDVVSWASVEFEGLTPEVAAANGFPTVGELITTAESVLADPSATNDQLVSATNGANLV